MRETPFPASHPRQRDAFEGLTIVLPCLDEAENLPGAIAAATRAGERCAHTHEIVVVDDGSTDETPAVAGRFATKDPRVRLIVHAENRGYGGALRTGLAAARMPWVLLIDADLQFDVEELREFLVPARTAELVVGWRVMAQGSADRRIGTALWNHAIEAALDHPVRDADCGFLLIRRDVAERLDLHAVGPLAGVELVVRSRAAGCRVTEIPVHHRVRVAGRGAGRGRRLSIRTLRELAALRRVQASDRQIRLVQDELEDARHPRV